MSPGREPQAATPPDICAHPRDNWTTAGPLARHARASHKNAPSPCVLVRGLLAVAAGFEPAVGGYPTLAFEASTFGRSDTLPLATLPKR